MAYGIVRSGFLVKVKFNLEHGVKAHRSRSMALLSLTSALDGGGGRQRHAPAALPSGKRPGTHCKGVWLGRVWTGAENLALAGPRTVQLVASRYND